MPLSPTLPNIAQLQHYRQTGRFDPSIQAGKLDVMKSASVVGLKIDGQLVGFGTARKATPEEIARLAKAEVSKSAELPADDLNAVFDDSPLLPDSPPNFLPFVQSIGVEVSKSATPPEPDIMEGLFPPCLRTN